MSFQVNKKDLLNALRLVVGVVEPRHVIQILSHILFVLEGNTLFITATNSEVQVTAQIELEGSVDNLWKTTIPGKKLLDICRVLPDSGVLELSTDASKIQLCCAATRFSLMALPAADFPLMPALDGGVSFDISHDALLFLLTRTHFAIAQHDVRYFFNGMLLEINENKINAVATDGHRLALNSVLLERPLDKSVHIIVPRKAITELIRLLQPGLDARLRVVISDKYLFVAQQKFSLISSLVQGDYPNYSQVLPRNCDQQLIVNVQAFKQALNRVAILTNDKFKGIRLALSPGKMTVLVSNPEQEMAEEVVDIDYQGNALAFGFNVNYVLDVLDVVLTETIRMRFSGPQQSVLLEEIDPHIVGHQSVFVIMPLTL